MENSPLIVQTIETEPPTQDISAFGMDGDDLLSILSMFDPYGVWKIDLDSGQMYWSRDVFKIHGIEYHEGPVDLQASIKRYHPEDQKTIGALLSEAIEREVGFRYVLRLNTKDSSYKLVKAICKHRTNGQGTKQLVGVLSEFALPMRSIATIDDA